MNYYVCHFLNTFLHAIMAVAVKPIKPTHIVANSNIEVSSTIQWIVPIPSETKYPAITFSISFYFKNNSCCSDISLNFLISALTNVINLSISEYSMVLFRLNYLNRFYLNRFFPSTQKDSCIRNRYSFFYCCINL